jgi:CHAT domain-containing protein/tetratricopeptide (TPR) repeat protein
MAGGFHAARRGGQMLASLSGSLLCALVLSSFCSAQTPSSAGTDPSDVLRRLKEARALEEKGLDRERRKLYESLLPELRAQKNEAGLAEALNALSVIASRQSEHELASAWARESADLYRRLADHKGEAQAVNNQGVGELNRGDYPAARAHFEQALALYQGINDREGEIEEFNNIGNVFYYQSWYLNALEAYEAAMARVDRAAGEPWSARRRLITTFNLATLFQRLGREEKALELYRQVRQAPQALEPNEEAQLYANLGVMYRRLGDPVKALQTYRQAQDMFDRRGHKDGQVGVLINIGIALALDLGDVPGALESFTNALALAKQTENRREEMQAHLYRGESLFRLGQMDSAREEFDTALAAAKQLGTSEEEWKALYALGRRAELLGQTELAAGYFRQAIDRIESIRSRLQLSRLKTEFLGDKRDVYDSLIELSLNNPDAAELFNLMERSRARTFQDWLQASAQGASASTLTVSLDEVRSRLDGSTLLLEFWAGPKSAAVVWVTRESSGVVRHHFPPADLDEISGLTRDLSTSSGEIWRSHSEHLGKLLLSGIEPIAHPAMQHLLIVPDGNLVSVPFEVLGAGAGGSSLLIERFDVSYLPAASILLRPSPARAASWLFPWNRRLVVFGDPMTSDHPDPNLSDLFPEEELRQRLPASAGEVQAIAAINAGRSEIHLGADDLKKYLIQGNAKGVPLLHLSTHATADIDSPERSRILFSSGHKDARPDYLFLRELYDLDLRGVELATLSACDTERGKMIRAEGMQGFSRALLSAGSRATVTTLWRVADEPTGEFMKQFYYALGQGKTKAQALRVAKLKFLRSGGDLAHPRHWAAFVLNGDGWQPVTGAFSWSILLAPLASALLLLSMAAHRRIKAQHRRE